jgi:hypothetical protein
MQRIALDCAQEIEALSAHAHASRLLRITALRTCSRITDHELSFFAVNSLASN